MIPPNGRIGRFVPITITNPRLPRTPLNISTHVDNTYKIEQTFEFIEYQNWRPSCIFFSLLEYRYFIYAPE
jgi:hypothetical protein